MQVGGTGVCCGVEYIAGLSTGGSAHQKHIEGKKQGRPAFRWSLMTLCHRTWPDKQFPAF